MGAARAAELLAAYVPFNLADRPAAAGHHRHGRRRRVAFVVFPPDPPAKASSWTQAPHVDHFPERFVVLGYRGRRAGARGARRRRSPPRCTSGPTRPPTRPTRSTRTATTWRSPTSCAGWSTSNAPCRPGMALGDRAHRRAGAHRVRPAARARACSSAPTRTRHGRARGAAAPPPVGRSGLALVPQGTPTHNTDRRRHRLQPASTTPTRASTTAAHAAAVHPRRRPAGQARRPVAGRGARHRPAALSHVGPRRGRRRPAAGAGPCSARCGRRPSATGWTRC